MIALNVWWRLLVLVRFQAGGESSLEEEVLYRLVAIRSLASGLIRTTGSQRIQRMLEMRLFRLLTRFLVFVRTQFSSIHSSRNFPVLSEILTGHELVAGALKPFTNSYIYTDERAGRLPEFPGNWNIIGKLIMVGLRNIAKVVEKRR